MTAKLTKRRLNALIEALTERLAGEIEVEGLETRDYEKALEWAQARAALSQNGERS